MIDMSFSLAIPRSFCQRSVYFFGEGIICIWYSRKILLCWYRKKQAFRWFLSCLFGWNGPDSSAQLKNIHDFFDQAKYFLLQRGFHPQDSRLLACVDDDLAWRSLLVPTPKNIVNRCHFRLLRKGLLCKQVFSIGFAAKEKLIVFVKNHGKVEFLTTS